MQFARIIGTVVASQKVSSLEGLKFLLLECLEMDASGSGKYIVAADSVGAGISEVVLYATGSSARQTERTNNVPCDAVIMAIVDSWEKHGKQIYNKSESPD